MLHQRRGALAGEEASRTSMECDPPQVGQLRWSGPRRHRRGRSSCARKPPDWLVRPIDQCFNPNTRILLIPMNFGRGNDGRTESHTEIEFSSGMENSFAGMHVTRCCTQVCAWLVVRVGQGSRWTKDSEPKLGARSVRESLWQLCFKDLPTAGIGS